MILGRQPRLDGLRAIAVAVVVENHFIGRLGMGGMGVRLFFVLSGYLISRIIFDYASRQVPVMVAARQFYWRRALRLTPPLYFAIAVTALLGISNMRQDWLWHALYLSNIKIYLEGSWGQAAPLWSLAVEEQFYLIWFFALIITPLRYSLSIIVGGIVAGNFFRIVAAMAGDNWAFALLPGAIDFFCLGALIAYAECFRTSLDAALRARFSSPVFVAVLLVVALISANINNPSVSTLNGIIEGLLSFCLVIVARNGAEGRYLDWLAHPIARHLGKISYGIYVYHYFVFQFIAQYGLLDAIKNSAGGRPLTLLVELTLTLTISELSWRLMEQPISKLKPLVGSERIDPERRGVGVGSPRKQSPV